MCPLQEWFIFVPFMVSESQNKNLVLCTLNCGTLLWAGISWADAGAVIIPGAWRKHRPTWAQHVEHVDSSQFSEHLRKRCSVPWAPVAA